MGAITPSEDPGAASFEARENPEERSRAEEAIRLRAARDIALVSTPALGTLYLVMTLYFVIAPPRQPAWLFGLLCGTAATILLGARLLFSRKPESLTLAGPITSAVGGAHALLYIAFSGDLRITCLLMIVIVGTGALMQGRRETIFLACGLGIAWVPISYSLGAEPSEWRVFGIMLASAVLLALLVHGQWNRYLFAFRAQVARANNARDKAESMVSELATARDQALASVEAKQRFLAHMSHEIRTPLNGILGMLQLIPTERLAPDDRSRLEAVGRSGDTLLAIVNDLLDLSRIEAGSIALETIGFDLGQVIEEVTANHSAAAFGKEIELSVDVDPDLPRRVFGDPLRIRQVATNLVSNAIKFTSEGEVIVSLASEEKENGTLFVLSVSDTGVGMSPEEQKRVFQPFTQADDSTTRKFGGTGLGLSIARQLIELMGGSIGLESAKGVGSTFRVEVTLETDEDASMLGGGNDLVLDGAKIMVLDANRRAARSVMQHLEAWGVRTILVGNVTEASQRLENETRDGVPVSVIVADVRTLGSDWLESIEEFSKLPAYGGPRVVLLSAAAVEPDTFERSTAVSLLSKPVQRKRLLEEVASAHEAPPHHRDSLTMIPKKKSSRSTESSPSTGHEILVVEDQEMNWLVADGFLRRLGYLGTRAENGKAGIERLFVDPSRFSMVLMDCQMPVLDGYAAAAKIREIEAARELPRTPIVALTAHALPEERDKALAAGMDHYLVKPLEMLSLRAALRQFCPGGTALDPDRAREIRRLRTPERSQIIDETLAALHAHVAALEEQRIDGETLARELRETAVAIGALRLAEVALEYEERPSARAELAPVLKSEIRRVKVALEVIRSRSTDGSSVLPVPNRG